MIPPNEIYGEGISGEGCEWACVDGEGVIPLRKDCAAEWTIHEIPPGARIEWPEP